MGGGRNVRNLKVPARWAVGINTANAAPVLGQMQKRAPVGCLRAVGFDRREIAYVLGQEGVGVGGELRVTPGDSMWGRGRERLVSGNLLPNAIGVLEL